MSRRAPRPSSAVLLTRGTGRAFEVYLVLRSRTMKFMGGFWAFPGGVASETDGPADDEDALLRACALRELFEETGVLVPPLSVMGDRADARRALLAREKASLARFSSAAAAENVGAAAASLARFARVTTPPFAPIRFATVFFHRELPPGESPEPDRTEVDDGRFLPPAEWLAAWRRGELLIAPPVLFILERLSRAADLTSGLDAVRADTADLEKGKLHRVRFTPGITVFPLATATLPPATTTNAFLVGEERFCVVDPAPTDPRETERFLEAIDERLARGDAPFGILLTHHHPDHVGALAAVRERLRVPVLAHPLTLARTPGVGEDARPIGDGDRLDLGRAPDGSEPWTLRVVSTPGHDRGHLSFVESRYRTAIAGDLVSTVSTIVVDPPEGHLATYLASLEKLLALDPGLVFPAHGLPRRDGAELLREYLAHRRDREAALVAALRAEPSRLEALLPHVYPEIDPVLYPLASRSLRAGLEKLAEEGRARSHDGIWTLST